MTAPGDLLTAAQAAPLLDVHPVTLLRFAREGRIESVLIGRKRRFRRSAIDAYLDGCTVPATASTAARQHAAPREPVRPRRNPNRTYKT